MLKAGVCIGLTLKKTSGEPKLALPREGNPARYPMKHLKLRTKLYLVSSLLVVVATVVGLLGLRGISQTNRGLEMVYNDRVVPLKDLKAIADAYAVLIIDAANKCNAGLMTAPATLEGLVNAQADITAKWQTYMATILTAEESKLAAEAAGLFVPANQAVDQLRSFLKGKTGFLKGALEEFDGPLYATIDPISTKITELVDLQLRVAGAEYEAAKSRYNFLLTLTVSVLAIGVLVGGGLSWMVTHELARSITQITDALSTGAAQTAQAASQVSASSQSLAEGASEQAASLEETSASLEELSSMTKRNADSAREACETVSRTRGSAEQGTVQMTGMQESMNAINGASDEITKILRTIDDIAFQTNILALNAAVEAARAGEAGAGFAVVADEVRALAQRSASAARETATRIEASVTRSRQGVHLSGEVATSFSTIQNHIKHLEQLNGDISTASQEQSLGLNQINQAVSQMDKVTQDNAAGAEETASASEELNAQAESMKESVIKLHCLVNGQPRTTSARSESLAQLPDASALPPARSAKRRLKALVRV